ncbi:MAG: endonuclease/exonuclease/phosphatase family protein, partial [Marinibacterium sp.]|nr:endonuclease/exonuclease/phosphatase family protein [Marinibacterium sp.]
TGQGGMALLARFAFDRKAARDFSALLWRDLPGASLPVHDDGRPFPSPEALSVQRLSSTGHWVVPVILPDDSRLTLMAWHAGPPVFDGPEDRNGLRNGDETRLWLRLLDGQMGPVPQTPFVVLGNANLDPVRGEGRQQAIRDLLGDARLHDPFDGHPPTVDWSERGPGKLRVSYVLPSADLQVRDAGIIWPQDGPLHDTARTASRHRLVWVDIAR